MMRQFLFLILVPIFLAAASPTRAQERPQLPAPAADAPFDARAAWCETYAAWFVARAPEEGPNPGDVRPTQRMENEINYCKLDPREYERQTLAELARESRPGSN